MPVFHRKDDPSQTVYVDPNDEGAMQAALADPNLSPGEGVEATVEGPLGGVSTFEGEEAGRVVRRGGRALEEPEVTERVTRQITEETFDTPGQNVLTAVEAGARGLTLGGSDAIARALGADPAAMAARREVNPYLATGFEIGGALAPSLLTGGAGAAGTAGRLLARTPAGLAVRAAERFAAGRGLGATVARGAAEGALFDAGEGLTQSMLSDDPVTAESILSNISSGMLYGGVAGGAGGLAGKALEAGLGKAARALQRRQSRLGELPDSVADSGQEIADELIDYSKGRGGAYHAIEATGADRAAVYSKQGTRLRSLADEPIGLAESKGRRALDPLRREAKVLRESLEQIDDGLRKAAQRDAELAGKIRSHLDELSPDGALDDLGAEIKLSSIDKGLPGRYGAVNNRAYSRKQARKLTVDSDDVLALAEALEAGAMTGRRKEAAAAAQDLLARNEALQAKITGAIEAGKAVPVAAEGFGEKMLKGGVFGAVAGIVPGAAAVPAAAFVADKVGDLVFRRAGKAVGETTERLAKALEEVVSVTRRAAPRAPVLASKVLTRAKFADQEPDVKGSSKTATAYRKRAAEIRSHTIQTPQGSQLTPAARQRIADRLAPVAAMDPLLADQLETAAARRLEYLADKLPKQPGLGIQTGPDTWEPSAFEIAEFARHVAAVEDPVGVLERAADGTMTTEDAEALREVYPELYAATQAAILERLPQLREQLPYDRRLMLGILFSTPVDPAMEPTVMQVLQGHFASEEPSAGGTKAPMPDPSFGSLGSVAKPEFTPAQERGAG